MNQPNLQPIWDAVSQVPEGKVASYGQIAEMAGMKGEAQFVGRSLSNIPKRLSLPWHRIIRGDGSIAFPEDSLIAKEQAQKLMDEGITVINNKIPMQVFQWTREEAGSQFQLGL